MSKKNGIPKDAMMGKWDGVRAKGYTAEHTKEWLKVSEKNRKITKDMMTKFKPAERAKRATKKEMTLGQACRAILSGIGKEVFDMLSSFGKTEKPKRARGAKGRYRGDDKMTDDINEAWVGGKAPKKKKK